MLFDPQRVGLVTIDVQCDTLDGQPLEIAGTSQAIPNIARLAAAFRDAGRPIVHIVRLYLGDGSNAEPCRRDLVSGDTPMLRPGTPGRRIASGVLGSRESITELDDDLLLGGGIQRVGTDTDEVVMYKPRWGAFYETALHAHLKQRGITSLVFAGCNFPNCPRTSVYEASERDYAVTVADDAVSGLYDRGREELRNIGVILLSTARIVAMLQSARDARPSP
jgi:nicotinamidase-related amidase